MKNNLKVAILSINIGQYIQFWNGFYMSAKENLLSNYERHFFVFTDHAHIPYEGNDDITVIHQDDLGWPGNTLMRFEMFCSIEKKLNEYHYVFFGNANLLFIKAVGNEVLPFGNENLVVVRRDSGYIRKEKEIPYEKNPDSTAYVCPKDSTVYVRGGFYGGKSEAFLEMCRHLRDNINTDKKNGIIAIWHDESHITRYVIGREDVKILFPGYLYPQGLVMPYEKKILVRTKDNNAVRFRMKKGKIRMFRDRTTLIIRNIVYFILIKTRIMKYEKENERENWI